MSTATRSAPQPAVKGLTDEQVRWIADSKDVATCRARLSALIATSIETEPVEGEPVAWRWRDGDYRWQATADEDRASYAFRVEGYDVEDLYLAPVVPQAQPAEVSELAGRLTDIASLLAGDCAYKQADTVREAAALLSSTSERLKAVEAENAQFREVLDAIMARDDRNGSLPEWYRHEIDAVYTPSARASLTQGAAE